MGSRGPVPKRDAERRRRNKPEHETTTITSDQQVRVPAADRSWCARAKRLWQAAKNGPMADRYQSTDWQQLALYCDLMTTLLRPGRMSPRMEAAIRSAVAELGLSRDERLYLEWLLAPVRPSAQMVASMNTLAVGLGLTEGDRLRMRIEITRRPAGVGPVTDMERYRRARAGQG